MEVTIVEREPMTIVGWATKFIHIRSPEATSMSVIGNLWRNVFQYDQLKAMAGCLGHPTWGVIWGDPVPQRSRIDELNYLAGVPFAGVPALPEGMSYRHVPGGLFAKITHRGPMTGLAATIEHLYGQWLPASGYEHAGQGDLELYDERFFLEGPEQAFDYFISVKPAAVAAQPEPQVTIAAAKDKDTEETGARSRQFNEKKRTDALRSSKKPAASAQPARRSRGAGGSASDGSKEKTAAKKKTRARSASDGKSRQKARRPGKKSAKKPAKKKPTSPGRKAGGKKSKPARSPRRQAKATKSKPTKKPARKKKR